VKPANLIADVSGHRVKGVKLIDFGLAAPRGAREEPGRLSGSLPFVSPEALLGLPLDGRADLYGLGLVLHLLAAGRLPAPTGDVESLLRWHLAGEPADPLALRPTVSPRLRRLILAATAREPSRRPADADEALSLLGVAPGRPDEAGWPSCGRGERAGLRLALDAARLGARRRFVLPRCRRQADELLRQARVWSRVRGIGFHRLCSGADSGRRSLSGMLLGLLLERGEDARRLARSHGLEDWVCPGLLPAWAAGRRTGFPPRRGTHPPRLRRRRAAALARFMLACSGKRPLVVSLEALACRDPLAAAVADALRDAASDFRPAGGRRGGLLLLEPAPGRLTPASAPGSSAPG
jgi:hypothetical protein